MEEDWFEYSGHVHILSFDGTDYGFHSHNSNAVRFESTLVKSKRQMVHHVPAGKTPNGVVWRLCETIAGLFTGDVELKRQVLDGYLYLVKNYHKDSRTHKEDKICIFGISRGARAAQALAGMIHKVGLLRDPGEMPNAYFIYFVETKRGKWLCESFKEMLCITVKIDFLGIWDAVGSVGLYPSILPFAYSNPSVKFIRHALSLDERRGELRPIVYGDNVDPQTDIKEVWFAGCHSDVTGGSVPDDTHGCLSNIPLRWMVCEFKEACPWIQFDETILLRLGIATGLHLTETEGSEADKSIGDRKSTESGNKPGTCEKSQEPEEKQPMQHLDLPNPDATPGYSDWDAAAAADANEKDALSPITDQLKLRKSLWLLDSIPMVECTGRKDGSWRRKLILNLGRPRIVPQMKMLKVHRTVKQRMDTDPCYNPPVDLTEYNGWVG